jgi:hypothetical protein
MWIVILLQQHLSKLKDGIECICEPRTEGKAMMSLEYLMIDDVDV